VRREEAGRGKERWGDVRRGEETRIRDRRGKHLPGADDSRCATWIVHSAVGCADSSGKNELFWEVFLVCHQLARI